MSHILLFCISLISLFPISQITNAKLFLEPKDWCNPLLETVGGITNGYGEYDAIFVGKILSKSKRNKVVRLKLSIAHYWKGNLDSEIIFDFHERAFYEYFKKGKFYLLVGKRDIKDGRIHSYFCDPNTELSYFPSKEKVLDLQKHLSDSKSLEEIKESSFKVSLSEANILQWITYLNAVYPENQIFEFENIKNQ
ncbi:MAG: hypothetical protein AAFY45_35205 [Bacteroidota bacterium]